ncbi:MAG: TRAP transporter small permease subunit [Bacillota bacterium]|nr:TRAP transporter small permease subunit [Bacillota bacterium]
MVDKIINLIDLINEKISRWVSVLVIALILTLSYEVMARYAFGQPTQWSFDLTYFLSSAFLILSMANTWKYNEHVEVDLISSKMPRRVRAIINIIFTLGLFFFSWGYIAKVMYANVARSWAIKELSTIGFTPPIYPYKTWILVGILMLLLQGVSQLIKELIALKKGEDYER